IAAGYTVADLSTRTHVRERVLRGIEEEDFIPCGGDFYARGHIRGLCRALGLDPEPLVEEYDREHAISATTHLVSSSRPLATELAAAHVAATRHRMQDLSDEVVESDDESRTGVPAQSFGRDDEPGPDPRHRGRHEGRRRMGGRPEREGGRSIPAPRRPQEEQVHAFSAGGDRPEPRLPAMRPRSSGAVLRHWPWALVVVVVLLSLFVGVRAWPGEPTNPLRTAIELIRAGEHCAERASGVDEHGRGGAVGKGEEAQEAERPSEVLVSVTAAERSCVQVQDTGCVNRFVGFLGEGETQDCPVEVYVHVWLG